jgi:hypothetical protein
MSTKQKTLELTEDEADTIREALLIGLACYGEVERIIGEFDGLKVLGEECSKYAVDMEKIRDLHPLHPTGNLQVVGQFAAALTYITQGAA